MDKENDNIPTGLIRIEPTFLWLPRIIKGKLRWLRWITIKQRLYKPKDAEPFVWNGWWVDEEYINIERSKGTKLKGKNQ